ncbi:ABC transporter substrate-binding protein [Actinophytocola sp.]|uniref:ABC transporter substrate-binding protein n=1 Tax=Actinophytocola sp. TaxID=1872138 RepID=UPI003D6AAC35
MAQQDEIPKPEPMKKWERRRRWRIPIVVILTAVLIAVGVRVLEPVIPCGSVNPYADLRDVAGECVGVTDGSYEFDPEFRNIQEAIKAENDWVTERHETRGTPAVKIALLSTLTTTDTSPLNQDQVRHGLEGAYVAQHRANRTHELGDPQRLIQLMLANEGSTQLGWEVAVDELVDMTDDDIPLAVVMGQGISTTRTTDAARKLSAAGIPMVTGTTMADGLDSAHIPGLIRAAPSNTDAATAIRHYLDNQQKLKRGILVYDSETSDTFSTTLRAAFEAQLADYMASSKQPFPGGSFVHGGPRVFDQITQNICLARTDMVFFAGRAPDFDVFLESLAERPCRDDRFITAVFVDLGPNPRGTKGISHLLRIGNMAVLHATGYDPGWPRGEVEAPEGFKRFHSHFSSLVGGVPEALDDGYAVTNHDAMIAAIRAVRITNTWTNTAPSPTDVREHLLLLNGQEAVPGATGKLEFNENRGGNPGGKHVPIVRLPDSNDPEPAEPYITPTT